MFWLLACTPAPPPSIELPLTLPAATNATAVPAARFVGALDVAGVDPVRSCADDERAALLREGHFGWRVLVLDQDEVSIPGPGGVGQEHMKLWELVKRWQAADEAIAERCANPPDKRVLIAVDAGGTGGLESLERALHDLEGFDVQLLVSDAQPGEGLPEPPLVAHVPFYTFAPTRSGTWAVLPSTADIPAAEVESPSDGVRLMSLYQTSGAVLCAAPGTPWSTVVEGLDALAAIGVRPFVALGVSGDGSAPSAPAPPSRGSTHLALGDTLSVLPLRTGWPTMLYEMVVTAPDAEPAPTSPTASSPEPPSTPPP
jgi:hypothetical protein